MPEPNAGNFDSTSEAVEGRALPELAGALRARIPWIVQRWQERVRQVLPSADPLTFSQVLDHLPELLHELADGLASPSTEWRQALSAQSARHGVTRFHENYNVRELITEHRLLRELVLRAVATELRRPTSMEEDIALNAGIDLLLQRSVAAFVDYQQGQLIATTEAERRFLSYVSHDLRNSLNSITLMLEVLKQGLAGRPELAENAADLEAAQQTVLETVDGMERLLQAERLRKAPVPKLSQVSVKELAQEVARRFAPQARRRDIALDVQVPPGCVLETDREWLTIVLQNLVSNAVKYSSGGTVWIGCEDGTTEGGAGGWTVWVRDQGPGIAPEDRERLFEAFQRGQTHGQRGVGLGLNIAARAAELLGGTLTVESQLGTGSTFRLKLPAGSGRST